MKRFVRKAVVAAAIIAIPTLVGAPAFAAATAEAPKKVAVADQAAYETEVVKLTNAERTARGCKALRIDDRLVTAARAHSTDMVKQNFFSHTGSDGSNFVTREVRAGYPRNGASAENIAWGYRTPQQVVTGWMNSPGHRKNILNCASTAVGVGVAYTSGGAPYWTQDFGRV
ncbi:CAP domain-containing protein [Actinoplanes sp. LDG1-06]|uniref:CAP domain-containing protein n=1 Tax=Paractinoplanes ovalisporus TaxID=2810368 RepID=A0ABS2AQ61_9ACTN|nr:CAP domain-containing protein [Actinoplanes ovalisporus]MBM2621888.1 CAP domain-containing protein [Actinoplanes ovalisporus]